MLRFLFPRLTADPERGSDCFAAIVRIAREEGWYRGGAVPDTLDGRFAVLATVTALVLVRLDQIGESGVAVTERFIAVMEAEHREFGLGDPALGRTVRKLVGSLARRNGAWQEAIDDPGRWRETTRASLYAAPVDDAALDWSAARCTEIWAKLSSLDKAAIEDGRIS